MSNSLYSIPETVISDTRAFRREVEKFIAGETSAVSFRAIRVPMGIYEQRENDTYMVRVRGAGGIFLSHQIKCIAELSKEFGNGVVHVTTRQDLQIHRVMVEDTPTILEKLLEAGLSSRGGGGNTVRNVSACPSAGACEDEVFDVTPYSIALTEYLIRNRANFNLPRKFKTAFSGCSRDCALASVADLGFFAHEKDGVKGFSVYAGGGMGAHSSLATLIEEFIPAESIFEVAEAVKRLFDKHGDRANRHRARLRFVLERVGPEEFRRLYKEELEKVRQEGITVPEIQAEQKKTSLAAVTLHIPLGDVTAAALTRIADLADSFGDGTVRTTQSQDLQIRGVQPPRLEELHKALRQIDKRFVETGSIRTIACAGASTCKLGLGLSRGLAEELETQLHDIKLPFEAAIRISGCPNSCGQHPIAPIGLFGTASRIDGRLVPFYGIVAGGRTAEGDARLAKLITRVPARAIPPLMKEFWTAAAANLKEKETLDELIERWGTSYLQMLAEKYKHVPSYEENPEYYRDFGSCSDFSLAGHGPGECGAGVMDVVRLDVDTARKHLKENTLYDAILAAARALLITRGIEPKKDREVFAAFSEYLISPGWVSRKAQAVLDAAVDFKLGDRDSLDDIKDDIKALVDRVEQLFVSLDSNLEFRVERIEEPAPSDNPSDKEVTQELDLRGVACPLNFVRAKVQLEQLEAGQTLDIMLDPGEPARNVPASFADQGEEVVSVIDEGSHFRVTVRKNS